MTSALEKMDPKMRERLLALAATSDQRPSGSISIPAYEIDKRGRLANKDDEKDVHEKMLVIPLLLRETRAYWARKGSGDQPDCRSIDGLKPVHAGDSEPQAETCSSCPWDKFGTAEGDAPGSKGAGKKCKTKGNLFVLVVDDEGRVVGPAVIRFSIGNRGASDAINAADRAAARDGVPRIAALWSLTTAEGKGKSQDYLYLKPEYVGPAPAELLPKILEQSEGLQSGGADRFLGASAAAAE